MKEGQGRYAVGLVQQVLMPTLEPGDVVIPDNFAVGKKIAARQAIEVAGATILFLPHRSQEFDPIDNAFALHRALLRKAAARTLDYLGRAVARILDDLCTPEMHHRPCRRGG